LADRYGAILKKTKSPRILNQLLFHFRLFRIPVKISFHLLKELGFTFVSNECYLVLFVYKKGTEGTLLKIKK
jgi:hypothetical protein